MKIKLDKHGRWSKLLQRQFLDKKNVNSYCVTEIEINDFSYKKDKHNYRVSGEVQIADCNRVVTLYFGKKDGRKSDKLINQLLDFQDALSEAEEYVNTLPTTKEIVDND